MGLSVAAGLQLLLEDEPLAGVDVHQSTRAGFELIDLLQGYERAIIIDALDIPEATPGQVRELSLEIFAGSARLNNPHELSVSAAFDLAKRMGIEMPAEVLIFGIEGKNMRTFHEGLSVEVEKAVKPLAVRIYELLKDWHPAGPGGGDGEETRRQAFYPPG